MVLQQRRRKKSLPRHKTGRLLDSTEGVSSGNDDDNSSDDERSHEAVSLQGTDPSVSLTLSARWRVAHVHARAHHGLRIAAEEPEAPAPWLLEVSEKGKEVGARLLPLACVCCASVHIRRSGLCSHTIVLVLDQIDGEGTVVFSRGGEEGKKRESIATFTFAPILASSSSSVRLPEDDDRAANAATLSSAPSSSGAWNAANLAKLVRAQSHVRRFLAYKRTLP
jgi:hypothetical protein